MNKNVILLLNIIISITYASVKIDAIPYFDSVSYIDGKSPEIVRYDPYFYESFIGTKTRRTESDIHLPSVSITKGSINKNCHIACQERYLSRGDIVDFLYYYKYNKNNHFHKEYIYFASKLNLSFTKKSNRRLNIALLVQKNIKNSTKYIPKSIEAYSIYRHTSINIKLFYADKNDIKATINSIYKNGYRNIIAIITSGTLKNIVNVRQKDIDIYIPTVNKIDLNIDDTNPEISKNIIFTGISFKRQLDALLKYSSNSIFTISNSSKLTSMMYNYILSKKFIYNYELTHNIIYSDKKKNIIKKAYIDRLNRATIFLNTPIIESVTILSKLSYLNVSSRYILSTQLNYNINLIDLVGAENLKNFIVANSINHVNSSLNEINHILGTDIKYQWANYTTNIALDLIFKKYLKRKRIFKEPLINNQVVYNIMLYKYASRKLVRAHVKTRYQATQKCIITDFATTLFKNGYILPL